MEMYGHKLGRLSHRHTNKDPLRVFFLYAINSPIKCQQRGPHEFPENSVSFGQTCDIKNLFLNSIPNM